MMETFGVFRALVIDKVEDSDVRQRIAWCRISDLPPGEVLIKVDFSSLNYKDALAFKGHPGIVRRYPHVPGIDAAGSVVMSHSPLVPEGMRALVTGYGLGTSTWGGLSEYIRVPAEWIMTVPAGMSNEESMSIGTAGLTAALCVEALIMQNIAPSAGEILVSGATGGVGTIACALLSRLGYDVVAVSRKSAFTPYLEKLGVTRVIPYEQFGGDCEKPLCKEEWAAAIDTLGGKALASILSRIRHGGVVAACGMVSGTELNTSVFPFILRAVKLIGIDSVQVPSTQRKHLWEKLANEWRIPCLKDITQTISMDEVASAIEGLLAGERNGRTVVAL